MKHPRVRWVIYSVRFCYVLVLLVVAGAVNAQTLSIDAFYRFGTLTTVDREPGAINQFSTSGAGTSLEQVFGIGPSVNVAVLPSLSLRASLYGGAITGSFVSDAYRSAESTTAKHFEVASSASVVEASVMPSFRLGNVHFALGPAIDLYFARSRTVTEVSQGVRGTSTDTDFSVSLPAVGKLAIAAEVGYELPIFTRPLLSATIRYDPYVNRYRSLGESIQTGIAIRVPIFKPSQLGEQPSLLTTAPISVRVGEHDLSQDSVLPVAVSVTDRLIYQELPLQFNVDSVTYLTRESANRFAEGDVEAASGIERHVLDVIASRLRSRPAAALRLHASATSAKIITRYLQDVWQLTNVVRIDSLHAPASEIRLSTDDPIVLLPISLHVIERSVQIPRIVIETGDSAAYDLVISAARDTLLRKVGLGGEADNSITTLPANVDLNTPLAFTVTQGSRVYSHRVKLEAAKLPASRSLVEVTFRASFDDTLVQQNRELLFTKLGGTQIQTATLHGAPDAEVQSIEDWLGIHADRSGDDAEWHLRVVGER